MKNQWKKLLELSFTVHTFEDLKLDSFKEILANLGWNFIKVIKLEKSWFVLTIEDKETMNMLNWEDLGMWVKDFARSSLEDLVVPRITWLSVVGLPFIVASEWVIEALVGSVGSVLGVVTNNSEVDKFPNISVCLSTKNVDFIEIDRNLRIQNKVFKVVLKEIAKEKPLYYSHHLVGENAKVDHWLDSTSFSDDDQLTGLLENEDVELEQAISMEHMVPDEELQINPDAREVLSRDKRLENWCSNNPVLVECEGEEHSSPARGSCKHSKVLVNLVGKEREEDIGEEENFDDKATNK